ncbi:MAG: GDSL-type esterase/lipase family protein [Thermodesulfobacteriota bacterium]
MSPSARKIATYILDAGVALYFILCVAIVATGGFVFHALGLRISCQSLVNPLGILFLLIVLRLVAGRNKNALLCLGSTVFAALVFLYGLEAVLYGKEKKAVAALSAPAVPTAAPAASVAGKNYDPLRNDGVNWTWGHAVRNNAWGFREREIVVPKPDHVFRIMVLGDSLTWGAGLEEAERYTNLMEDALRKDGQQAEVLNFGIQAAPTTKERDILRQFGPRVSPDLVVLGFCYNDPQPRSANWSKERARLEDAYAVVASLRYLGMKRAYHFLIDRVDNLAARHHLIPSWHEALDRVYQQGSPEWTAFSQALSEISAWAREYTGQPPVFAVLTQNLHRGNAADFAGTPEGRWFARAAQEAAARGFVVADPAPLFAAGFSAEELAVNPLDSHPSAKCNRAYAETLLRTIEPMTRKGRP